MPKHTPGPWAYAKSDIGQKYSIYHNGPIAYCGDTTAAPGDGEANARLIADAPALLDALRWALDHLGDSLDPDYRDAFEAATALVARHD